MSRLNSDYGYPSLAPARPTYLPACHCHTDPQWRNSPIHSRPPEAEIMDREAEAEVADQYAQPHYLFRSQNSWSLTPIGER